MPFGTRRLVWILTLVLGCSDEDTEPGGGGGGGGGTTVSSSTTTTTITSSSSSSTSASTGSSSSSSAGGGGGGGGGEGGGGTLLPGCTFEPDIENRGKVRVLSSVSLPQSNANASFTPGPGTCFTQLCGPCRVEACVEELPQLSADAGTITISGGNQNVQLEHVPNGGYTQFLATQALFGGGELITVESTGGAVPAFTQVLEAPSELLVGSPSFDDLVVPLNQDFEVTWTGDSAGDVEVILFAQNLLGPSSIGYTWLTCQFPVSAGSGTVPSTALQALPIDDNGTVYVQAATSAELTVGTWSVRVGADGIAAATSSQSGAALTNNAAFR